MSTRLSLRRGRYFTVALLLAFGSSGLAKAQTSGDYDTWSVQSKGELPFRSVHSKRTQRADGNYQYTTESRTLVNLLGQRQEMLETFNCLVTPSLAPISCEVVSQTQAGAATVRGRVEGAELVLDFERGDARFQRRLPLAGSVIFGPCVEDYLIAHRDSPEPLSFNVVDAGSWNVNAVTAERLPEEDGLQNWRLAGDGSADRKGILQLDAAGRFVRLKRDHPYQLARSTPEEAGNLQHLEYEDRELLSFSVNRNLPFPERLLSMTVALRWTDTPPESLELEDSRQHVVREQHDGQQHEVVLRLSQPPAVESPAPLPVAAPGFAAYLADTDYIRPSDDSIRERARTWTTGASTTLEAVTKLCHEVSRLLEGGELVAETLSGPEVLACRKGKCSEFTTLLASLTRAAGVPTRVALGMRLSGGRWIGHMWCEVWVGDWIPVDATVDEVGGSPALLKLTHSATVMGTQAARFALAKSLEVDVLEVEQDPKLRSQLKTGIVRDSYTNADFAWRLTAPTGEWRLEEKSAAGAAMVRFHLPGAAEKGPQVHFLAFGLPPNIDPALIARARRSRVESQSRNFGLLAEEAQPVGALKGQRSTIKYSLAADENKVMKTTEILWIDGRSGYLLNLIAEEADHDAALAQFEALLRGFEALDPEAESAAK